jgi:hypothetical protein
MGNGACVDYVLSRNLPLKEVSAHLATIRAAHPADYDAAKQALLRKYTEAQPEAPRTINGQFVPGNPAGMRRQVIDPATGMPLTN